MSRCALALLAVLLVCGCSPVFCEPNFAKVDEVLTHYEKARSDPALVICFEVGNMYSDDDTEPMSERVELITAGEVAESCHACSAEQMDLLRASNQSFCTLESIVFVDSQGRLTVFDTPGSEQFRELMRIDGRDTTGASCFKSADVTLVTPWWRQ